MNATITGILAIALYGAATADISRHFLQRRPTQRHIFLILGSIALIFHCISLLNSSISDDGVRLGFFPVASLIGAVISALAIFTSIYRPIENITIMAYPLSGLTLGLALIFPSNNAAIQLSSGISGHIIVSIAAYSVLAIATGQALLLALQHQQLKAGHIKGLLSVFPPIQTTEKILFEFIWVGFTLLALTIISGWVFVEDLMAQHLAHKTVLTMFAWALFGILLTGRHFLGWRGRTAIRWTFSGFTLLVTAFFGSKLVLELILQRT